MRAALFIGLIAVAGGVGVWTLRDGGERPHSAAFAPVSAAVAQGTGAAEPAKAGTEAIYQDAGFRLGEAALDPSEVAGREIWYKATAGNARFHTYVFQQRMGVLIDWYRVLRSDRRDQRFRTWGLINDPDCCTPGSTNCAAKSMEETYGFDYCLGDAELLKYVGKPGYRDPACDLKDAPACAGRRARAQRPAPVFLRPGVRHLHRRARLSQVSQPALQRREVAQIERRQARHVGRLRPQAVDQSQDHRRAYQPSGRRLHRAAVPDRHVLRLLPHRLRSAQPAQGCRTSRVEEHQGRHRQPVPAHRRDHRVGHADRQPRVADLRARASGDLRHVGHSHRSGEQPRHHQRHHQHQAAADASRRGHHQVAQERELRAKGARQRHLLVRARAVGQMLAQEPRAGGRAPHPEGR